jgi:hypothetical protein
MDSFVKLYKLLKYSNKSNKTQYLNETKNFQNFEILHKLAKNDYLNKQKGGEYINLSECKEIYISNFHGKMVGESFKIPDNTWVIVPFGSGFVNYLGKEEKEFFLQNKDTIMENINKNNGKSFNLFGKNFLILKPNDNYCNVQIQINFDNMIDEGLYEIEHSALINRDPFYRKMNFGDIFTNPLNEDYLVGFNILQKYKEILRIYMSKKQVFFNINSIKNDPEEFYKNIKMKISSLGKSDRICKIIPYSTNDFLIKENISRILYPFFIEKTTRNIKQIYENLIQKIKNFKLPANDSSSDFNEYTKIINNFIQVWGDSLLLNEYNLQYKNMISNISTIEYILTKIIEEIQIKNLNLKYPDNFNKLKNINDELIKDMKHKLNYEIIFDTIFKEKFSHLSTEKISLIDHIQTSIDNSFHKVLYYENDGSIVNIEIFDLIERLNVNVRSLALGLYYSTSFCLVFFRILSTMSDISLDLLKTYLTTDKPLYLSDIIESINATSDEKKIIFSRSCQGFDQSVSIENAAKCLKYTTEFDLTNVFNQNSVDIITKAILYIKDNNLDNIFNENIGHQDEKLYYDLICILSIDMSNSDIITKIFIVYLKKNYIELYNYFKFNMEIPTPTEEKVSLIKYQEKIVLLILNLFIKSVFDKVDDEHKKNISDIMNL